MLVSGEPPFVVGADTVTERMRGPVIVRSLLTVTPLAMPEIVDIASIPTVLVVTVNPTVVAPEGTLTVDGTVAFGFELDSVTVNPAEPALLEIVNIAADVFPPTTDVGVKFRVESTGAVTIRLPDTVVPVPT